ncbi:MAG: PKD domain-containing protein [Bacteroidales bacterium]|nr:PKD domain-containing protein [Bacteroidales bacterium]
MKPIYYLIFAMMFSFLHVSSYAQRGKHGNKSLSVTNTIVNEYTVLTQNANTGDITLNVQNSALNANSRFTSNLQVGDLLMIIQMQGASSNSYIQGGFGFPIDDTWGSVSNYNNCGLYEFVQVKSIPNASSIVIDCGLRYSYTATGKTQVIRVPRYQTLTINSGGVLTCDIWDGEKGGVVSVEVNGNSIIHSGGSMYTTGKGFRGGELENDFMWGGGQWAATNSGEGAEKGESILGYKTDYDAYGGRYCRGAPANGGGGGNTHNSGGGGGANGGNINAWNGKGNPDLSTPGWATAWNFEGPNFANNTSSGGGKGGYSFSNSNQNALSLAPNNSAWGGDYRRNNGGLGGRPLDYSSGRIFLGGGGGSGEENDTYGGVGGRGGGIVYFLSYGSLSGDGQIVANGDPGQNSSSPWGIIGYNSDGAGGGGGAGTVIMNTFGTVSGITIRANGGVGGDQNIIANNKVQAQGPGGGGGGGYIAVSNGSPVREALAGLNGTSNSSSITEFIPNGATKGGVGTSNAAITNYQIVAPNDTVCGGNPATLTASLLGFVPPNTVITWYDSIIAGNVLGTGNSYTTPPLNVTTTYYVGTCPGHYRVPVTVFVINTNYSAGSNVSICVGGSVTLNASGGTSYQWSPATGLSNPNIHNPVASPASTTTYTVSISDNIGCSGTASVVVTVDFLVAFAGNDTSICAGGQVQLIASGGLNYQWASNPSLNQTNIFNPIATPIQTTTYTVTVSDNTGCQATDDVIVSILPLPQANAGSDLFICQGGSVNLNASGGVLYEWQPSSSLDNPSIPNPLATPNQSTTYIVGVTDNFGCQAFDSMTVFLTTATAQISNDTTICPGSDVQLFSSGGISYVWSPGYGLTDSLIANPIATPSQTTTYTVQVTDSIGCIASASVTISIGQSVIADFTSSGFCQGQPTSFFDSSIDSSGQITDWNWNFGDGLSSTSTQNPTHQYVQPGTYAVLLVVSNNLGCMDSIQQTITINPQPQVSFVTDSFNTCAPAFVEFINLSDDSLTFQWFFGDGTASTLENPQHIYQIQGNFSVVLSATTIHGCSNFAQNILSVYPAPVADFSFSPNPAYTGSNVSFSNTSTNATTYLWYFGDGGTDTELNPTYNYSVAGTYTIELYVQNNHNCTDSTSQEIIVEENVTFYVPNAFTPNGNNINDRFGPVGIGINNETFEMYIFDRWGGLQFHSNDINNFWNGKSLDGTDCMSGVYTWVIFFQTHSGTDHKYRFTGTVTLL